MKTKTEEAISLLQQLIAIESFSKTENKTADFLRNFLDQKGVETFRVLNNVGSRNKHFDPAKPTLLLNSHHDTVKPNSQYSRNPFEAKIEDGKLFGLGSNDAGGPLVSLLFCFLHFYDQSDLKFNILFVASAEEEISGTNGIELVLPHLGIIDLAIVGEPTGMNISIAEKGLLVLDCTCHGIAGHTAREEGVNAIYLALDDIDWFKNFDFPMVSKTLGKVKMTVSMISAGVQHNSVPEVCQFTVDIRSTDCYSNEEILEIVKQNVRCELKPRSLRLNSSYFPSEHPLVKIANSLGAETYGSPTCSDQALMNFPSFKMGPGNSARSHSADEFIFVHEIKQGIDQYIQLLQNYNSSL